MLENSVEGLGQNFTYEFETLEERISLPLKPNGENIEVTDENKREFVRLLCQKKLTDEIRDQIKAFKRGFHILIPEKALELMAPSDLEYIVAGEQVYDLVDWKENFRYGNKLSPTEDVSLWFWEILESFTNEELSQYLYFVTGKTSSGNNHMNN